MDRHIWTKSNTTPSESDVIYRADHSLAILFRSETRPLLPRSVSPAVVKAPYQGAPDPSGVPFPTIVQLSGPAARYSYERLGWSEYALPDSTVYYANSGMHVTTDIDLRNAKKFKAVADYVAQKSSDEYGLAPPGWELWLRDAGLLKKDFMTVRNWVNHKARVVSTVPPHDVSFDNITDDDRLDMEYRYWVFLEGHPAHAPLPAEARAEAMDALSWSYTDFLLPSQKPVPPPFSPQECQELMRLLRSSEEGSTGGSLVHTRIVARVLLRKVQWRQHYFRPHRPLPHDTNRQSALPTPHRPFGRTIVDFFVSCLCLGIPYLFLNRSHHQRIDEESGTRSAGSMLMVDACACLVAAVILSASVTFISLPGLDDVARLAGLIAILFSASSMISTVIALFRYKAERTVVYVGGEGLMMLSTRSIIMSLPLVFLAWAIAAFMTGITFYSFRGATLTGRMVIRHPFEAYTHWAVVGTLGGLGGVLLMCALLARR
ncbi:hypothetical protein BKA93DRAFT_728227 [Sparassis latifolia]